MNYEEQIRDTIIVSRIPKASLYVLVLLCFFNVLFGIYLASAALILSARPGVMEILPRFRIPALVSGSYERERE